MRVPPYKRNKELLKWFKKSYSTLLKHSGNPYTNQAFKKKLEIRLVGENYPHRENRAAYMPGVSMIAVWGTKHQSPGRTIQSLAHEVHHAAKHNKYGDAFAHINKDYNESFGYENNPFEIGANRFGKQAREKYIKEVRKKKVRGI